MKGNIYNLWLLSGCMFLAACDSQWQLQPISDTPPSEPLIIATDEIEQTPKELFSVADLMGKTMLELNKLIGRADAFRRQESFQIWQYRLSHCVIDIFFSEQTVPESAPLQATYIFMHERQFGGQLNIADCEAEFNHRIK